MPKGVRKITNYVEEIEKVDLRIIHHANSIKELEDKKALLTEQKNQKDFQTLASYLQQNNLNASDLLNQLNLIA